jgi:hypothetical protein
VAAQGAAGLLKEDRRGLSLWVSVLNGLLYGPFFLLVGVLLHVWVGALGAGAWAVFAVSVGVWHEARRRGRARG